MSLFQEVAAIYRGLDQERNSTIRTLAPSRSNGLALRIMQAVQPLREPFKYQEWSVDIQNQSIYNFIQRTRENLAL